MFWLSVIQYPYLVFASVYSNIHMTKFRTTTNAYHANTFDELVQLVDMLTESGYTVEHILTEEV